MSGKSTKIAFLDCVMSRARAGLNGPSPLMTSDEYARDHVRIACEAIQLGLLRLRLDPDGYGYELQITRAGKLLAAGHVEQAAASIEAGANLTRLTGDPPAGILGTRLAPGSDGMSLHSMSARQFAPELMRGVATRHLTVANGVIHATTEGAPAPASWIQSKPTPARDAAFASKAPAPATGATAGLPSSRAARHVSARGS